MGTNLEATIEIAKEIDSQRRWMTDEQQEVCCHIGSALDNPYWKFDIRSTGRGSASVTCALNATIVWITVTPKGKLGEVTWKGLPDDEHPRGVKQVLRYSYGDWGVDPWKRDSPLVYGAAKPKPKDALAFVLDWLEKRSGEITPAAALQYQVNTQADRVEAAKKYAEGCRRSMNQAEQAEERERNKLVDLQRELEGLS